jgi:hypothetical protein
MKFHVLKSLGNASNSFSLLFTPSGTKRATLHVRLRRVGELVVDHAAHVFDVQPAGRNVRRDQRRRVALWIFMLASEVAQWLRRAVVIKGCWEAFYGAGSAPVRLRMGLCRAIIATFSPASVGLSSASTGQNRLHNCFASALLHSRAHTHAHTRTETKLSSALRQRQLHSLSLTHTLSLSLTLLSLSLHVHAHARTGTKRSSALRQRQLHSLSHSHTHTLSLSLSLFISLSLYTYTHTHAPRRSGRAP